jgi:hypothetical protein
LRQDAVSYCLQALQLFEGMDQQRFMAVLSEVAAMGLGGLQINEPDTSRSLKTLPGSWSDLALACLIHVGIQRLMPDEDSGLGIGTEYEEALRLHKALQAISYAKHFDSCNSNELFDFIPKKASIPNSVGAGRVSTPYSCGKVPRP